MTQTVNAWLNDLNSYWTPSPSQFDGARSHRDAIEGRLKSDGISFGMWEIGSLNHGTGIWRYSDVDYLASMTGSRPTDPWTTLNRVKSALQARFQYTAIEVRQPAVVCRFSDGDVEVVPGFYAGEDGYWIPDPTGSWMKTYPSKHNGYVTGVSNKHNGGVKKLARQLKAWKYQLKVPVSSCYLEMRAAKHLDGETTYVPLTDLAMLLNALHEKQLRALNDPTGLSSRFTAYSSAAKKSEAMSKLATAVTRVNKAHNHYVAGEDGQAISQLRLLFDHSH